MKQIDPNHFKGAIANTIVSNGFTNGFLQKIVIKISTLYMRLKVKKFLNFSNSLQSLVIPKADPTKKYLLYIHIPFCKTLCPYCSFHKFKFQEKQARIYFRLLRKEMELIKKEGFDFVSLYIGGGTTTVLPDELAKTIDFAKKLFSIKEVSCEGDPHIQDELIEILSQRVDRFSIGLQSTNDLLLQKIKRYKKFGAAKEQLFKIKKAIGKFPIINIDLIFNLPNQTISEIHNDLDNVLQLSPEQISYYPLMYSPSVKKSMEKNLGNLTNNNEALFYKTIVKKLSKNYRQISAWTFSKKEKILDEYVVEYNEYIGLGSGSFSFIEDTLYINTFSLKKYQEKIQKKELSLERYQKYSLGDILDYQIMLDMFANNLSCEKYLERYNIDIESRFKIRFFLLRLVGVLKKGSLTVTPFGNYFCLVLLKEFYIGMDYVRETSRGSLKKEDHLLYDNEG